MTLRPSGRDERLASAKICRAGAAHQSGRLTDAETLVEIRGVLAEHQVTGDRVVIVLADAASAFVDNPLRARADRAGSPLAPTSSWPAGYAPRLVLALGLPTRRP